VTTPEHQAEADAASAAFHTALVAIGAKTVADALVLWEDIPPTGRASAAASWLNTAIRLVMGRRRHSRELARAYYRLTRALLTGSTVADPYHPEPERVSLQDLREQFAQLAAAGPVRAPAGTTEPVAAGETEDVIGAPGAPSEPSEEDELDRILVEEIEALREEEERLERAAEEELRTALEALGPKNLDRKLKDLDLDAPANEVDEQRKAAHKQAGARQAAAASRVAMNGARSTLWTHQERDSKALGYVRVSRTGTPCAWCAMLISRGPVYKSERSATLADNAAGYVDGDKYHDNCNCYAVPVFSLEQYAKSSLFRLNREYAQQWPQATQGLSGKSAVTAWRRFYRQNNSSAQVA
jgi:hypothetical protein